MNKCNYRYRILVLGFYHRRNLGDDLFEEIMPYIFPDDLLTFVNVDDLNINSIGLRSYDVLICGGGDLINDYFHHKMAHAAKLFHGPIIAMSLGIPYPSLIDKGYLDYFDHVFLREKTDLLQLQYRLGAQYAHALPDMGFYMANRNEVVPRGIYKRKPNKIGFFLAQPVHIHSHVVDGLVGLINHLLQKDYEVVLYRFNTSVNKIENDALINEQVKSRCLQYNNLTVDNNAYTIWEMVNQMKTLQMAVCMRFHAHILCTVANTPFLSISGTRKVQLFVKEERLSKYAVPLVEGDDGHSLYLNLGDAITTFNKIYRRRKYLRTRLAAIADKNRKLWQNFQPARLLDTPFGRRNKSLPHHLYYDMDNLYQKARNAIIKYTGYDVASNKPPSQTLTFDKAQELAEIICFDVIGMAGSAYVYGTTINLQYRPQELYYMIDWMQKDFKHKYERNRPRFCIEYISQHTFRGLHRAGWQYVVDYLRAITNNYGVMLDTYIDRTFGWGKPALLERGILPYTSFWVGFVHHTYDEQYSDNNNVRVWEDDDFQRSLHYCKGIFVLSHYLAEWWRDQFSNNGWDIPVEVLTHPTQFNFSKWRKRKFDDNPDKMLINIGAWYRNPFSIYTVKNKLHLQNAALRGKSMDNYFPPENFTLYRNDDLTMAIDNHESSVADKNYTSIDLVYKSEEQHATKYDVKDGKHPLEGSWERPTQESVQLICRDRANNMWVKYLVDYLNENNHLLKDIQFEDGSDVVLEYQEDYVNDRARRHLKHRISRLIRRVQIIDTLSNDNFDKLLSENIVFLHLVTCSAVNTIIECIVRGTPIVVNRIPAAVEALGPDYPLYYDKLEDIPDLLTISNIKNAHKYLKKVSHEQFRIEHFMQDMIQSKIYQSVENN